jgi:methyl-accepting chemotaxis protein
VVGGGRLVDEAAGSLRHILEGAQENAQLVEAIARASAEQSVAIAEINIAVRQLDEMTQHNAALVEQTNAAVEQTEGEANELDAIVGTFTVAAPAEPSRQQRKPDRPLRLASSGNLAISSDWTAY